MSEQLLKERNQNLASQMVASERERRMAEDVKNGGKRRRESMDVRMKEEIEGGRKKGGGEGEVAEVAEVAVVEQRKTSSDVKIPPRNRRKSIKKDFGQLVVGKSSSSSSSPSPKKVTSAPSAPPAPPAPPPAPPASAASAATTTAPAPGLPVLVREIMNFNNCDEEAAKEMIIDDVIGKKF